MLSDAWKMFWGSVMCVLLLPESCDVFPLTQVWKTNLQHRWEKLGGRWSPWCCRVFICRPFRSWKECVSCLVSFLNAPNKQSPSCDVSDKILSVPLWCFPLNFRLNWFQRFCSLTQTEPVGFHSTLRGYSCVSGHTWNDVTPSSFSSEYFT